MADGQIAVADPRQPDVRALLARHLEFALAQTPPEHSFALDAEELLDPAITFFSVRGHGSLLGIGAIKRLGPHHAEIKSMHTAEAARGRGIGRAMLTHLLGVARTRGFRRVSLETGTTAAFAPGTVPKRRLHPVRPVRRLPAKPGQPVHDARTRHGTGRRPVTGTQARRAYLGDLSRALVPGAWRELHHGLRGPDAAPGLGQAARHVVSHGLAWCAELAQEAVWAAGSWLCGH
jgi:putative acetyltransferase